MTEQNTKFHSRYRQVLLTAMLVLTLALLAACGSGDKTGNGSQTNTEASQQSGSTGNAGAADEAPAEPEAEPAGETTYPLTLTDSTGTEVVIAQEPERVVSLVPSETEILYAIGASEQVAGVDDNSNYPEEVADKPKVGGMDTNIEAVAGLNPDLVIANGSMNGSTVEALRKMGVTVFASEPKTIEETIAHIEQIGVIVNRQQEAQEVAEEMRTELQTVLEAVKGAPVKKVYLEFSPGWTVGKGKFLDEVVTLAGGENVAGDQEGWFAMDAEKILQANPDVIIYPDMGEDTTIIDAINSRPGWNEIAAVKNGEVHAVSNDPLVRVGPRLTDGLLEVAKAIHPDRF
ncbi:ABC transporter substrate-binding protein [Paenibacillus sambharensis]|uniref:ABC transporter substrate-binding protein n=1 Tax=Paenibacillus sambharensis TaxID=1803190 RepID=A0A2W1LMM2_9BACL|nr:ABC transporter substrate-binding protein [Paenibacillus sambharensis]PZD96232.1 ABC transporter substrate-binding protein [Paenibacillus sambharensis]